MSEDTGDSGETSDKILRELKELRKELKVYREQNDKLLQQNPEDRDKPRDLELGIALISLGFAFVSLAVADKDYPNEALYKQVINLLIALAPTTIGLILVRHWLVSWIENNFDPVARWLRQKFGKGLGTKRR